ncbi:pleckstrin homology-like domain family B member 1 isoform X3 [Dama dama]|uniref:pleckstrin homology-like domain family B member 1 isoform X3 n=1 Tax=Dama dama TaxID=30532 RepID=UPI002A3711C3|nr:pleckstrin homology-like domain family B member 1 isoform X3 [Dama dama]
MDTLNRNQVGPGCKTPALVQKGPLDLIETGKGLKVQTDKPHLVSLGSGRLSTAITLLPLEEGRTVIGSAARDISLQGPGLAPEHCYIENLRGTLTLYPCGNACTIDGLPVRQPTRLTQGCMLCLGQSTFLRFNHPAEAKWMKSMIPAGGRAPGPHYGPGPESESLVNGNHTPQPATRGPSACGSHSSLVSSIEKDLQEIMDSLVLEEPGAAGKKPAATSPLSPMANGGRYLLSPPTSPGAMSVGSSYENTSPAFSPLSSPASSGSCASHSPSGQEPAPSLPPLVPARSSSYHLALQPPQSRPSGARPSESPRLGRKGGHERPPSPGLRGLLTDSPAATVLAEARRATESPRPGGQLPVVAISLSEYPASSARGPPTSIPSSPKFQPPVPAPRNKIGTLQDRPPSPFREPPGAERVLTTSPSRQLVGRTFSDGSATRTLQPPESPRLGRRGLDSMRELPPLSPSLSRRALSPMPARTAPDPKLTRDVAESPRSRRWAAHGASPEDFSLTLGARGRRTRSPSPTLGESLAPRKGSFSGRLSPAYSLGSLTGASPRQSPRAQRKLSSGDLRVPITRERKNSITEISDNEDDLLEYHRRQRQERLREQEMERLERQRLETILNLCAEYSRADGEPEAGELPSIGEAAAALALAGRRPSRGLAVGPGAPGRSSEEPGGAAQRLWESVERSDEENLKEECSSTESTQQEHEDAPGAKLQGEVLALEEERAQVLGRVEQLKVRVKELEQQLQESAREAEMERALLQGEREAERALLQKEQKAVDQLQEKLMTLETSIQKERDKERAELAAGRRHLEARQALYAELQTQLDNCPESVREQLQEQLRRVSFTKPPSPPPRAARPEERSGGPGAPGPCSTCRTPGRPRPWRQRRSSSRTWSSSSWSGRAVWRRSASWRARGCSGARPNCSAASPRGRSAWWSWTVRLGRSGPRLCRSQNALPGIRMPPCSCCRRRRRNWLCWKEDTTRSQVAGLSQRPRPPSKRFTAPRWMARPPAPCHAPAAGRSPPPLAHLPPPPSSAWLPWAAAPHPRALCSPRTAPAAFLATWQPPCRTLRPSASWPCSRRGSR